MSANSQTLMRSGANRRFSFMLIRTLGTMVAAAVAITACKTSDLNITNPNVVTVEGAKADPNAIPFLAVGMLVDLRALTTSQPQPLGIHGREAYNYTPTEGRNTSGYIIPVIVGGTPKLDPAGFSGGLNWGTQYNTMRDSYNFKLAIDGGSLTAAQKSAARGFAETIEGLALLQVIAAHDTLGAITEIRENPTDLAPFAARDSVYKAVIGILDAAHTKLQAGGTAFPFTLHAGFAGFNTPATYGQFNRAIRARAGAYYATSGGGAAAWQGTLTALAASFLNGGATTRAQLDAGVYGGVHSAAAGDVTNGLSAATSTTSYAHMSIQTDAQLKADGTRDNRYIAKTRALPARSGLVNAAGAISAVSTLGFSIWPLSTSSMATIRNEELIMLRAEARLATGDKTGAIADINQVRINSGGLAPSTLTAASSDDAILTGILYEKRYSTLMEGLRWIDHRRYGKLALLPLDIPSGPNQNFVAKVIPIPQGECLVRAKVTGALRGPSGQDNCAP